MNSMADARAFVLGVVALDAEARATGVLVTSGASSVPAVAAAILALSDESLAARLESWRSRQTAEVAEIPGSHA